MSCTALPLQATSFLPRPPPGLAVSIILQLGAVSSSLQPTFHISHPPKPLSSPWAEADNVSRSDSQNQWEAPLNALEISHE